MLKKLRLKNVALITEAEISFVEGFNVLSGETGSGKSVILDALNFVLGAKADKTMIRHGEDFCLVEAVFSSLPQEICDILAEYDVEYDGELIVKRKFDSKGNGYIKVNGENFTSAMLKKITSSLVDVHGQSEHFVLLSRTKQLDCVDVGANTIALRERLKALRSHLSDIDSKLEELGGNLAERARKVDLLKFQIDEITAAALKEDEEQTLIAQRERLINAEKIFTALSSSSEVLSGEDGAIDRIISAEQALRGIFSLAPRYNALYERLSVIREDLSDVAECSHDYCEELNSDDLDVDQIERRIETYRNLKRKYGGSVAAVNEFLDNAQKECDELLSCDDIIDKLTSERLKAVGEYYEVCVTLSEKRKKYAREFAVRVKEKLAGLGMPSADFYVEFGEIPSVSELESFSASGLDHVEFMFSANAGEPAKPLSKIISGGEMSRFMLALKTQAVSPCSTYVFDEIDAGISGVTANVVAENFAQLSTDRQVIAISHLPQIAAMSDLSLYIAKSETDGKTFTTVCALDNIGKLNEIIRLVGGNEGDKIAVSHARNLITNAEKYKKSLNRQ